MRPISSFFLITLLISLHYGCGNNHKNVDHLNLKSKLSGKWAAKAFDGELREEWGLSNDGWMHQESFYIEAKDTTYFAKSQIQKVGEDIILFTVIRNSNPKIFKSTFLEENKIIFKNDDYKNPYEVTYEFISTNNYKRTIKGVENDTLVSYEFSFEKIPYN